MNILIRKLIFNESELHLILWKERPCFFVTELSKAFDGVNKEDIPVFLRSGGSTIKGIDFDVIGGAEARDLRSYLENSGIKKKFAHTMLIYFDGLRKYLNFRKTMEAKDFLNYLTKCKISLDSDTVAAVGVPDSNADNSRKITDPAAVNPVQAPEPPAPTTAKAPDITEAPAAKADKRAERTAKPKPVSSSPVVQSSSSYSDLLKHISFMEEFVDTFNRLNVSPDKSIAFTKSMVKFFEDNGVPTDKFLKEIKKWIV